MRLAALILTWILLIPFSAFGKQLKVAVIDTGLDLQDRRFISVLCPTGHKDFTTDGLKDFHGHGTHVAGLIKQYAKGADYCLVIIKYYSDTQSGTQNLLTETKALKYAFEIGVDLINLSAGGPVKNSDEYALLLSHPNVPLITCAGNENRNLDLPDSVNQKGELVINQYYPASYRLPNIVVVGAKDHQDKKTHTSNYGNGITYWELGELVYSTFPGGRNAYLSGTSQATAIVTGKIISGQLPWPKAEASCTKKVCPLPQKSK